MAQSAVLGSGLLGGAFAEPAAKRGNTVVAWKRSRGKLDALAPHGVAAAAPAHRAAGWIVPD